jgi:hypothetical protein
MLKFVEKTALIITDGAESSQIIADAIEATLKQCRVVSVTAGDFEGTQLLAADICFLGVEEPKPSSFSYLEKLLKHINLANRPCGIFSSSPQAVEYLRGIVHDSELVLYPDPFMGEGDIKIWVEKVVSSVQVHNL